ncbi:hypothetical protein C8J57DRAFT_1234789 [Mycena rebaudengoi]|nr:hypothetical protein C8J57DRAFT_1234789 [Mycena rebaudengoi]
MLIRFHYYWLLLPRTWAKRTIIGTVLNPELQMLLEPGKIAHIPAPFHAHLTVPGTLMLTGALLKNKAEAYPAFQEHTPGNVRKACWYWSKFFTGSPLPSTAIELEASMRLLGGIPEEKSVDAGTMVD